VKYVNEKDNSHSICIFVASKKKSFDQLRELERKLNKAFSKVDVIHVHGSLDKKEKFWFICIFCANIRVAELYARVLLATPAANIGIDNDRITLVINFGWPRDLLTYS